MHIKIVLLKHWKEKVDLKIKNNCAFHQIENVAIHEVYLDLNKIPKVTLGEG